jgi:hypothetical protein
MATAAPERYHALDALRAGAMFLGVLLHAAIPYTRFSVPFWPVHDERHSIVFDVLLLAIHNFRMQVFFLLAGFFGCLLYTRYNWQRTALHRLKRIALPLALAMLTIQPAIQAASVYAATTQSASKTAFFGEPVPTGDSHKSAVVQQLTSGDFLRFLVHLWFLWFLLLFFAAMLPMAWVADHTRKSRLGRLCDSGLRALFESRWRWPILAAATWPLLLSMEGAAGPDTSLGWSLPAHLLAYYFLFFLTGWSLYRHRNLLTSFASGWKASLALGNFLVLPVGIGLLYVAMKPERFGLVDGRSLDAPAKLVFALYTWLMIGGLFGLALTCLSRERMYVRWFADSAYWCYLASVPPIVLFQYLATGLSAPAIAKFAVVAAATSTVLLTTYQWGVRHTWIGMMLNGTRSKRAQVEDVNQTIREPTQSSVPTRRAA